MSNPRELADKAISLLQDALRDSEARVAELSEEIDRRRPAEGSPEEQLATISQQLAGAEAEVQRREREAHQLEEVLSTERSKVQQLKKKLSVAESGPDRLSKKEVNFWRQRAEQFDERTRDYKTRITELRGELESLKGHETERGAAQGWAASDTLDAPGAPDMAEPSQAVAAETVAAEAEPSEAVAAEVEAFEPAAAEAGARMDELEQRLADADAALADADAALAGANAAIDERNARITALAEQLGDAREQRPDDQQTPDDDGAMQTVLDDLAAARQAVEERDERIAALVQQLEQPEQLAQKRIDYDNALQVLRDDVEAACKAIDERDKRIVALTEQLEQPLNDQVADEGALLLLRDDLEAACKAVDERDKRIALLSGELDGLRHSPPPTPADAAEMLQAQLDGARSALAEREARIVEMEERARTLTSELNDAHEANATRLGELDKLRAELHELRGKYELGKGENEELGRNKNRLALELSEAVTRAENAEQTCRSLSEKIDSLELLSAGNDAELDGLRRQHAQLEAELSAARERIDALEATVKEEKEFSENLSELANERRERVNKLEEDLEVTEERFEEAKWQLGRAEHYKRLVQRRKSLIRSLIAELRAKTKANRALKAGLDGLRTFKAAAEINQQKLLSRLEALKTELGQTTEQLAKANEAAQEAAATEGEREQYDAWIEDLNGRLNMQNEIIGSLEDELKIAKSDKRSRDELDRELETLRDTLKIKSEAIERLESEIDDLQGRLGKLRGSESETTRLKTLAVQDKDQIGELELEISELREQLAHSGEASGSNAETDQLIARLKESIRERDETIARLEESVETWKKKYKFVSAEPPPAYQTAAE